MPTIEQNLHEWGTKFQWIQSGDEWSAGWGGAEAQWFGTLYPRIHAYLPSASILEIAPGYGRWTNYLRRHCTALTVVDLNENCIAACRERFAADTHITYHVNDGQSLDMI